MNRIRFLATTCAIALVTSPVLVFAQAPATPDPDLPDRARRGWEYGYGHMWGGPMWGDRWGWHPGLIIGPIIMALVLIGIVALIVSLVRWFSHTHDRHHNIGGGSRALDILEERFARGGIDKADFEDRRRLLGR
ncbi:MAG: SHOCT domain-containing protein [Xanthobacteraceae bacterium]